jgi:hypothetical protein
VSKPEKKIRFETFAELSKFMEQNTKRQKNKNETKQNKKSGN